MRVAGVKLRSSGFGKCPYPFSVSRNFSKTILVLGALLNTSVVSISQMISSLILYGVVVFFCICDVLKSMLTCPREKV